MNQSHLHPSLRQASLSTPVKSKTSHYPVDTGSSGYSPIQPSPSGSYHNPYYAAGQSVQDSPDEQSPDTNPADPNDLKRPRACEACRQLKVKCEPDETSPIGSCKRCAKAHRQCVVTVPSRKRQKKTDSRVAELEKKIDALTATLAARGGSIGGADHDPVLDPAIAHQQLTHQRHPSYPDHWQPSPQPLHSQSPPTPAALKRKPPDGYDYNASGDGSRIPTGPNEFKPTPPPMPQFHAAYSESQRKAEADEIPYVDPVDRNIIDAKAAYKCFDRYNIEMCKHLPAVVFPKDCTAEELRRNKPILFLAVLAVASGTIKPNLQPRLISETLRLLGDRIIYCGEKSMEIVQAVLLLMIFYQPPEKYEELNFNQLTHTAAVMAMDLGMGKRSKKGPYPVRKPPMDKNKAPPDPNSAETRRCWLGCYYMCTNSAMSLRRPQLIRWSPYNDECIEILSTAKDAVPSDKWLCQLVKAQHIGESVGLEFSMDDPVSVLSLTDPKTQRQLRVLEHNLAEWRETGGDLMNNPVMRHTEAIINLYMHEIAMHHNHNIDDFKPPFITGPIEGPPNPERVTQAHVQSLTACLRSAHDAFEAFLSMDLKALRALPTHLYVRNSYAAVALIKLYSAVAAKGSKFGSIFELEELKVDLYLDRLIQTLQKVAEGGMSRVAQKFTAIFSTLRNWHMKRTATPPNGTSGNEGNQQSLAFRSDPRDYKPGEFPPPAPPLQQDMSQTQHWSNYNRPSIEPSSEGQQAQNRLQILSDAAMGPGRSVSTHSGQWVPQPHMGQLQQMPVMDNMGMPQDFAMMGGAYGPFPLDPAIMSGFTSDDFMAFGLSGDWANFGFSHEGSWAF